jgi:hypothetical protein
MMKKSLFLLVVLALVIAGGAFAQRVGDTIQAAGSSWTVESVSSDRMTLVRAAQGDGPVNWVAVADSSFGTSNNQINDVAFGNNTWVAVGQNGKIAYSADNGRSWTGVPAGTAANQSGFRNVTSVNAVAFANNMFIAVGGDGTNASLAGISYSTDGRTWTMVDVSGAIPSSVYGIAFANNRFVAISNGRTATPTNGSSGTAGTNAPSSILRGIAFGSNRWVVVGQGSRMGYSTDGASWTAVPQANNGGFGQSSDIYGLGFGNNRFAAAGANGRIAYSTDGATWTAVANTTFTAQIRAVAYGNGRFVAVGSGGRMAYCDW